MLFQLNKRARHLLVVFALSGVVLLLNSVFDLWHPRGFSARASGYLLLVLMLGMWAKPLHRMLTYSNSLGYRKWHELGGIVVILVLLFHAIPVWSVVTFALSLSLLLLGVLGVLEPNVLRNNSVNYLRAWWQIHIILGLLASSLVIAHVDAMVAY